MPSENGAAAGKGGISGHIAEILALSNDSKKKTFVVAIALCLVCAVFVASAAVFLRPLQIENQALDRQVNILEVAGLLEEGKSIDELFQQIEPRVIDLETGEYVDDVDPVTYDQRAAAKDPQRSVVLPPEIDVAKIGRRAKYATVYLVKGEGDQVKTIILPIHGYGLWSTMYAYLALRGDANTVLGINFYEQGETPGLGAEITNPKWRAQFEDKLVYDESGKPRIEVVKGQADPSGPNAQYQVDGLAGATITSNGVLYTLRYWLGENGFGPYLAKMRSQRG